MNTSSPDIISSISNPPYLRKQEIQLYKSKYSSIDSFITDPHLNIGFFIGSSGSGKYFLTLSYLQSLKFKYDIIGSLDRYEDVTQFLEQAVYSSSVIVCRQFLKPKLKNCHIFYNIMRDFKGKIIFVLNNTQYTYKNIKRFIKMKDSNGTMELTNAAFIQFTGYTKTQMKIVVSQFQKKTHFTFDYSKSVLSQLTDLHSGDARKVLNQLYLRTITMKNQKVEDINSNKVSIFHFLGKLLYNKRLVVHGMEKKQSKKCSLGQYRQATAQQLVRFDPPFYFDPIQLMKQSSLPFQIILGFLLENFRKFYCSLQDNAKFNKLLAVIYMDRKKSFKQKWRVEQQFDNLKYILLSHGIMIYNVHGSERQNSFLSLVGPKVWQYNKDSQIKLEILHRNIPELTLNEILELHQLSRYYPEKMFPLVAMINKVWKLTTPNSVEREISKNQHVSTSSSDVFLNRNVRIQRNVFQDYDEISSDDD